MGLRPMRLLACAALLAITCSLQPVAAADVPSLMARLLTRGAGRSGRGRRAVRF